MDGKQGRKMKKKKLRLSVIIPTYNRVEIVPKCIESLEAQSLDKSEFEVIIVDDGSTDRTGDVVSGIQASTKMVIHYIFQENKGPAGARNTGIKRAKGEVIWITGDDYVSDPQCLKEHLEWHEKKYPLESGLR